MTQRIRSKAFASLLRQEMAYFDQQENSSGAICMRLSTDASAIQYMAGTRLSIICETAATFFFGILFGLLCEWPFELMLIFFGSLLFFAGIFYLHMWLASRIRKNNEKIIGQANSVRLGC